MTRDSRDINPSRREQGGETGTRSRRKGLHEGSPWDAREDDARKRKREREREGESEREKESYNPLDEVARREFYRLCTRSQKYLPGDPISRFVPFLVVPETICLG